MCICSKKKNAKAQFNIKNLKHLFSSFWMFQNKNKKKRRNKSKVKTLPLLKK